MAGYTQERRPMRAVTPLGPDVLLLVGFSGREALSEPFEFDLDLIAENAQAVPPERLLDKDVTVALETPRGDRRYFNGVCCHFSQGARDSMFTTYRLKLMPQFGRLALRTQSRIFQHLSVPDILKEVLRGLDVSFDLQGTFHPRDFCVQYRETDLNFASRLMEDEGIFY